MDRGYKIMKTYKENNDVVVREKLGDFSLYVEKNKEEDFIMLTLYCKDTNDIINVSTLEGETPIEYLEAIQDRFKDEIEEFELYADGKANKAITIEEEQ